MAACGRYLARLIEHCHKGVTIMSNTKSQPKSTAKKSDQPPANLFMGIGRLGQDPILRVRRVA